MPELPEVEVVRAGLEPIVTDAVVTDVRIDEPRTLRRHRVPPGVDRVRDFTARLGGARLLGIVRRGKFAWMPIGRPDGGTDPADRPAADALVLHLGMSGQVLLRPEHVRAPHHVRARFRLDVPASASVELLFVDQRIFGSLAIEPLVPLDAPGGYAGFGAGSWVDAVPESVARIGRDPLDPHFDENAWRAGLRSRTSAIKRVLLNQDFVSGIGNIYADEALWAARLHPLQPAATLKRVEADALLESLRAVLRQALAEGGTSFDSLYVNVNGQSGYFSHSLNAYGQQGKPCPRCGSLVVRESFMNRGSHLCPHCQRLRRRVLSPVRIAGS